MMFVWTIGDLLSGIVVVGIVVAATILHFQTQAGERRTVLIRLANATNGLTANELYQRGHISEAPFWPALCKLVESVRILGGIKVSGGARCPLGLPPLGRQR